ncbi:MAG: transcriptional regulator [Thermoplasmata archaeon]|nr:MAG: transcriptional regulator [Thermoplasmata archaeon]
MIEITTGTVAERILKQLQKTYPITVSTLREQLGLPRTVLIRELEKLQTRGVLQPEPLPGKIYIRLTRSDFRFVGKRRQRRFIKKSYPKKPKKEVKDDDDVMYV